MVQVSLDTGKVYRFWMSGTEAARHVNVAQSAISLCARGYVSRISSSSINEEMKSEFLPFGTDC